MMTVREAMEFLAQFDKDAEVVVCNWSDSSAIRVFTQEGRARQLVWKEEVEEDTAEDF